MRPKKKFFFHMQYKPFLHQFSVKVVFGFIAVWVKSNSLLMLVTYLFLIFHLQCNQDKDLQATAQTTRNRVHMNDKLLMVRVESSLFAVVVVEKFDFFIACYLKK